MKIILRILINMIALALVAYLIPGVVLDGGLVGLLVVALIFGLVNAFIRPIVLILSLPITCLTLGLFTLVINAAMLGLTAWLAGNLLSFSGETSQKFLTAILASIIITIVSAVLSMFFSDDRDSSYA